MEPDYTTGVCRVKKGRFGRDINRRQVCLKKHKYEPHHISSVFHYAISWLLPCCFTNFPIPGELKGQSVLHEVPAWIMMMVKQEENKLKLPYVQVTQWLSLSIFFWVKPWPGELISLHIYRLFFLQTALMTVIQTGSLENLCEVGRARIMTFISQDMAQRPDTWKDL